MIASNLSGVKHCILILSGKGGVGKSTVTAHLARALASSADLQVGVLDVDICGPSQPQMLGVAEEGLHSSQFGLIPVLAGENDNISVISVGFLLSEESDAVIWRGPKKNAMIKQFLNDVCWGKLDYLLIDTPPGTSDEHISVMGYLRGLDVKGGVLVTTPQMVSLQDVKREINFCKKVRVFKALQHNLKLLF